MSEQVEMTGYNNKLEPKFYNVRNIIKIIVGHVIFILIIFLPAGRFDWINGWALYALTTVLITIHAVILYIKKPGFLIERMKMTLKGTKTFDKIFFAFFLPLLFGMMIIAGIDAVRFEWTSMPDWLSVAGAVFYAAGFSFFVWAMAVNPHFEPTVRIQEDRDHKVITTGPYKIMRHPGYVGASLAFFCMPVILGSWWGLAIAGLIFLLLIIRTALEDRTLLNELEGYRGYAKRTRYRLIPFVW